VAALSLRQGIPFALLLSITVSPPALAQLALPEHKLEHPEGVVLDATNVMLRTAKQNTPIQAMAGILLFAGDTLENTNNGSIVFVLCADRKKRGLPPGSKIAIGTGAAAGATTGATTGSTSGSPEQTELVSVCMLPDVDREPVASENQSVDDLVTPPSGETLDDRVRALPDQEHADFVSLYNPIVRALQRRSDDLTARIARAVLLEKYKLNLDASDEYRSIWDQWPGAVWARGKARDTLPSETDSTAGPGKTYALVVGISHYEFANQGINNLQYSGADAMSFADFLAKPRGGGLQSPNDLTVLPEQDATPDAIRRGLDAVLQKAKGNDTVVLFFAAHGAVAATRVDPDTNKTAYEGFILTYHSTTDDLSNSAVSMDDIRSLVLKNLGHLKRVLLYVDVCHAAQIGVIEDASRINEMILAVLGTKPNTLGIFMASRPNELAFEAQQYGDGHGAFTYFLLRGLNGDADLPPTGNGDGVVTAIELLKYVKDNVGVATRDNQHPQDSVFLLDSKQPMSNRSVSPGIELKDWSIPPAVFFRGSKYTVLSAAVGARGSPGVTTPELSPFPDLEARFDRAIQAGRLRADEPDSAAAVLDELRSQAHPLAQEQVRMLEGELLVGLENRGQSVVLRYLKGDQVALKREEFLDAALDFEAALRLSPGAQFDESREKFCRGRAMIFDKQYAQAVELLEQAIRLDPARAYAYNALGIAYLEQVDKDTHYYDYATEAFRDAIERAPYWAYPRHNLALALTQRGAFQLAALEYKGAIHVGPHYSYLPYNLGLLYQQIADFPQAKTYYEKARKIAEENCGLRLGKGFPSCPERSLPRTGLAALETGAGHRRKALKLLKTALADDAQNLIAAHDEAVILAAWRGREAEAEPIWTANLASDPKHLPSLIGYSELLSRECRFGEAIPRYRDVLKQLKDYVPAQIGLARALAANGELGEAGPLTEALVKQRPSNAQAWAARAEFLSRSGGEPSLAWANALRLAKDGAERKQIAERRKGGACVLKNQPKH